MYRSDRLKRITSVILIYILFIQELIPFARAIENYRNTILTVEGNFLSQEKMVQFDGDKVNANKELDSPKVYEELKEVLQNQTKADDIILSTGTEQVLKALTNAGQTENSGYTVSSTDGLVDKFTGDFNYSIPLLDVEGFPITITYNSNVGMNTEASWVGLGWDLSVGSVSRQMRGVPDDFNGEQEIERIHKQKDDNTENGWKTGVFGGIGYSPNIHQLGAQITLMGGGYKNSYVGNGKTFDFGVQASYSIGDPFYVGPNFGFGFSVDSKNGIGKNSSIGLNAGYAKSNVAFNLEANLNFNKSFNSRAGATEKSLSISLDRSGRKGFSVGTSTYASYGTATSVPRIIYDERGSSNLNALSAYYASGMNNFYWLAGIKQEFYSSTRQIVKNTQNLPVLGYLHLGKKSNLSNEDVLLDYNRTGEYAFSERMKNLPFSFVTYDLFMCNALGISQVFRGNREDYGNFENINSKSQFEGDIQDFSAGFKQGIGNQTITVGAVFGNQDSEIESGEWTVGLNSNLEFVAEPLSDHIDKAVYFKAIGENTPKSMNALMMVGGDQASKFSINSDEPNREIDLTNNLITNSNSTTISSNSLNNLNEEVVIGTKFIPSTAADLIGADLFYYSKPENGFVNTGELQFNRNSVIRESNHLSQIKTVTTNGTTHVFGIPAYSLNSSEVSFSTNENQSNSNGVIEYDSWDNSLSNDKGLYQFYDKTTIPAYAHSFLLTEILSSDYIDRTNNGPSNDDMGNFYKFNYTQIYGEKNTNVGAFKWKYPMDAIGNVALLNKGFEGTDTDNTAYYTYGEKEVWYVHTVESKNFIAEFYLENREDAYGVINENGGLDTNQPLKLLRKIVMYNKSERLSQGVNAIPIQTVEFEYDYSLCKKNPSNKFTYTSSADEFKSGKLTLKKIRIQTGKSVENKLQAYDFTYSPNDQNFNYANVDGWGNYKLNDPIKPNDVNPYANQNSNDVNLNASTWKLVKIGMPSGGELEIDYEADNYQYVQNKRAMEHFDLYRMTNMMQFLYLQSQNTWNGVDYCYETFTCDMSDDGFQDFLTSVSPSTNSNEVQDIYKDNFSKKSQKKGSKYAQKHGQFVDELVPNNVIIFKLNKAYNNSLTKTEADKQVLEDYFKDTTGYLKELFFRTHVNVDLAGQNKELIPSFALISDDMVNPFDGALPYEDDFKAIGVMPKSSDNDPYLYGYVVLNPINSGEFEGNKGQDENLGDALLMNPLQRTAIEFVRQNLPDKIYGSCDGCDTQDGNSIDWKSFFGKDIYKFMIQKKGYVNKILTDYSTVRLYDEDNVKYASTARVKKLTYKDNWNAISGEALSTYSWTYLYQPRSKTFGVASFEPRACLDENPFYLWKTYVNVAKQYPDETKFSAAPIAESLFPSPIVGYSEVNVEFANSTQRGSLVSTFYTAYDFPTIEKETALGTPEIVKKKNILSGKSLELYGFSQGYYVRTNDFHGKIKEILLMDKFQNTISRTTYKYYDYENELAYIDRKGMVSSERSGIEFDFHSDSKYVVDHSEVKTIGVNLNVKFTPAVGPYFPLIYPIPVVNKTERKRGFFSSTFVKHVNYSAIVKSIETQEMMSINNAENILYDKYSGNVLSSSLKDEFNDKLYSFNYPSHWYYKELREISDYADWSVQGSVSQSYFSIPTGTIDLTEFLAQGDLVNVFDGSTNVSAYVLSAYTTGVKLIKEDGTQFSNLGSGVITISILKPNRENRLDEVMQSVVTKKAINCVPGVFNFPNEEILSSSVLTYDNRNNVRCVIEGDKIGNQVIANAPTNPFLLGVKGDLVAENQFSWQSERKQSLHNHGIRFDGEYVDFESFYELNSADLRWYKILENGHSAFGGNNKWRESGEVTVYDEFGKAIESVDQIKVPSAVLYGYNSAMQLVPVAQSVNAKQQDIAFDGIEDYSYYSTDNYNIAESHFDFDFSNLPPNVTIDPTERHSGLKSLKIVGPASIGVYKKLGHDCAESDGIVSGMFVAQECVCIKPFEPRPGEYVVGLWVKEKTSNIPLTYTNGKVHILLKNGSATVIDYPAFTASGPIIDGWQRIEGVFAIPEDPNNPGYPLNANGIEVILENFGNQEVFFDDIRIHPFLASMSTVVYDPKTLMPLATHDGNNFTTFYNYDENLSPVRVRVETTEGIKTVSESEFGSFKKY